MAPRGRSHPVGDEKGRLEALLGGRYAVERPLGRGGSGSAWLVREVAGGTRCVLKVVPLPADDPRAADRVRREAEALRALAHPHVVRLREAVVLPAEGLACLVTDLVEGVTLLDLGGRGVMPRKDVLDILVGCARGLSALHRAGLVHRDLQPRNVVVGGEAGARKAVLVDLGLATLAGRHLGPSVTGTLGFTAPEVLLHGNPDARSDLYSLGAVLFFLLTGAPPVDPEEVLPALARGDDPFRRVEERVRGLVSGEFAPLVARLLSRYPAARYQSAPEVVEAVNLFFGTGHEGGDDPPAILSLAEPPFVARKTERRALLRAVLRAREGKGPRLLAVAGARGSGRSRLLRETAALLALRGVHCGGGVGGGHSDGSRHNVGV